MPNDSCCRDLFNVKFASDELRDNGSIIDIDEIKRKLIQGLINNYDESLFGSNVNEYVEEIKRIVDNIIIKTKKLKKL
ncbi:unnamed protein product [Didymodactylos carnosus]|uniref:Uncharacterized protein n=1 Tax=Didymodactylos carnosus TaxID=1234261 RepID=A0A8S2FE35_9BILA|nr:unnamed protein product [Didymodactylos carnosus]CAF4235326.1 unnamed protein product [Didymodactylos carnosus]